VFAYAWLSIQGLCFEADALQPITLECVLKLNVNLSVIHLMRLYYIFDPKKPNASSAYCMFSLVMVSNLPHDYAQNIALQPLYMLTYDF